MKIRDVLLGCFMIAWVAVTVITAWKTGKVPTELWAVPGVGIGALMALFRTPDSGPASDSDPDTSKEGA